MNDSLTNFRTQLIDSVIKDIDAILRTFLR